MGRFPFSDVASLSVSTSRLRALLDPKAIEDTGCDHSASALARPEATRKDISVGAIPYDNDRRRDSVEYMLRNHGYRPAYCNWNQNCISDIQCYPQPCISCIGELMLVKDQRNPYRAVYDNDSGLD